MIKKSFAVAFSAVGLSCTAPEAAVREFDCPAAFWWTDRLVDEQQRQQSLEFIHDPSSERAIITRHHAAEWVPMIGKMRPAWKQNMVARVTATPRTLTFVVPQQSLTTGQQEVGWTYIIDRETLALTGHNKEGRVKGTCTVGRSTNQK